jgi:O-antigen/teichoic acid export membrane protein
MLALVLAALTNVLYAHYLAPAQIGRLAVLIALSAGILLVADGGLQSLIGRQLAIAALPGSVATTLLLVIVPSIAVLLACLGFGAAEAAHAVAGTTAIAPERWLLLVELLVATQAFQAALALTQSLGLYGRRSACVAANGLATAIFTTAAFLGGGGFPAAVHATAAAYLVAGLGVTWAVVRQQGLHRVGIREWAGLVRRAAPLFGNGLLSYTTSTADVLLAAVAVPLADVGVYQVLKKVALVALAPLTAVLPLIYSHLARIGELRRGGFYRKVQTGALVLIAGTMVGTSWLVAPVLQNALGGLYAQHSALLIVLLAIGGVQFTHNLLGYVAAAAGRFARPLAVNLTVAVSGITLGVSLGRIAGLAGFVAGLVAANVLGALVATRLAREFVPGCVELVPASVAILAAGAGTAVFLGQLPIAAGAVGAAMVLLIAACVYSLARTRRAPARLHRLLGGES